MRGWVFSKLVSLMAIAYLGIFLPVAKAESEEQANIRVYKATSGAVVSIRTNVGNGSGTIIDPSGLILTSAHVVRGASKITVSLANQQRYQTEVLAVSRSLDLALLKLQAVKSPLPFVRLAPSAQVEVGQRVFAIGDPFGRFAGTLSTGIISRIDRQRQLLQTDAALNPGNSGGPLLNSKGELIGISTSVFMTNSDNRTGIGFAVTSDTASQFVSLVQQGKFVDRTPETNTTTIPLDGKTIFAKFSASDDTLTDGSYYHQYRFAGQLGQTVQIEMRSNEMDSFLALFDPSGVKIAEDDDSGGQKDALIRVTLPAAGTYTIYANSYAIGELGKFSLTVKPIAAKGVLLQKQGRISALTKTGTPVQSYEFRGEAGQLITINLSSPDFQPLITLVDPSRRMLKQDAAERDRRNAEISLRLTQSGIYQVLVNSFERQREGEYSLTVRQSP